MRLIAITCMFCCVVSASSQIVFDEGKPPVKERSPQLEALNDSVGKWEMEFVLRITAEAKEFKGKGSRITTWSPNGQFLISDEWFLCPGSGGMPNFWGNKISITAWDEIHKEYCVTEMIGGRTKIYKMTLNRNGSGRIQGEDRTGNHVTRTTVSLERISQTEAKVHVECSVDDGPTWTFLESTEKKISK